MPSTHSRLLSTSCLAATKQATVCWGQLVDGWQPVGHSSLPTSCRQNTAGCLLDKQLVAAAMPSIGMLATTPCCTLVPKPAAAGVCGSGSRSSGLLSGSGSRLAAAAAVLAVRLQRCCRCHYCCHCCCRSEWLKVRPRLPRFRGAHSTCRVTKATQEQKGRLWMIKLLNNHSGFNREPPTVRHTLRHTLHEDGIPVCTATSCYDNSWKV